jgi:hypothetical protein
LLALLDELANLPAMVVETMIRANTIVGNPDNIRRMADYLGEFGSKGRDGEYAFSRFVGHCSEDSTSINGVDPETFGMVMICAYYCACIGCVPHGQIPRTVTFDMFGMLAQIANVLGAAEWAYGNGYTRRAGRTGCGGGMHAREQNLN